METGYHGRGRGGGHLLEIAIIGLGGIARKAHLPLLAVTPGVKIVGLASRTGTGVAALEAQYRLPLRGRTLAEILAAPPRAAFVLSSTSSHPEVVCALLDAGVDVFMEKPLSDTEAGAQQIVRTAERTGRTVMVGFNRRHSPFYVRAKESVPNPSIIQITKHRNGHRFSLMQTLLDDTIHIIDLMRYFGGEPETVHSVVRDEPNSVTALFRFPGGVAGILSQSYGAGQNTERLEVHGGGITAMVEEMETLRLRQNGSEQVEGYNPWAPTLDKRGFAQEHAHFFHCLRTGDKPVSDAADALRTQQLALRILDAGRR